jgi:hypothetical protein
MGGTNTTRRDWVEGIQSAMNTVHVPRYRRKTKRASASRVSAQSQVLMHTTQTLCSAIALTKAFMVAVPSVAPTGL